MKLNLGEVMAVIAIGTVVGAAFLKVRYGSEAGWWFAAICWNAAYVLRNVEVTLAIEKTA